MENNQIKQALREPTPKDRVKFRVGRKTMDNKSAHMLAYVDARYVQDRLDDVVGADNWSNSFNIINDVLYCNITITFPNGEIVTKSDCGTESNVEKQKGQTSDAFKRAAVMLGVGRDLYDVGNNYSMWADLNEKGYPDNNWKPSGWDKSEEARHVKPQVQDSAKEPVESQPPVQEPETPNEKPMSVQEKADEIIGRAVKNAPEETPYQKPFKTIPKEEQPQENDPILKEGTPPEDEWVVVKRLKQHKESDKSFLFIPEDFEGNDADFALTKPYWVAKSQILKNDRMNDGLHQVVMKRWMAKSNGVFKFEDYTPTSEPEEKPQVEAPVNPIKDDDLPF